MIQIRKLIATLGRLNQELIYILYEYILALIILLYFMNNR